MRRYSTLPFPAYAFLPGQQVHPEKPGGHMYEGKIKVTAEKLNSSNYHNNQAYLYSIDLYNHGFPWEAHVYLEELWNLEKRVGKTADFLKGVIKLCASKVNYQMGKESPGKGHFERAKDLFKIVGEDSYMGIDIKVISDPDKTYAPDFIEISDSNKGNLDEH